MDKNDAFDLQKTLTEEMTLNILSCIHQYDGEVTMATVVGVLAVISHRLIAEAS